MNRSPDDLLTTGSKSAVAQWLGRFTTKARRQARCFGLVGLCHIIKTVIFQAEKPTHEAVIFSKGLLSLLGGLLVTMKTRAIKREKKPHCSLLQNTFFFFQN